MNVELSAEQLTKSFSGNTVLRGISFACRGGNAYAITGHNGSGKSTLLQIIATLFRADSGSLRYTVDVPLTRDAVRRHIGFVSPYLTLYEEFTPLEMLTFAAKMRGETPSRTDLVAALVRTGINYAAERYIHTFSSGMKQRVKFAVATYFSPAFLLLDEPMTNLDEEGIATVHGIIREWQDAGRIVLVATNEERDVALCSDSFSVVG